MSLLDGFRDRLPTTDSILGGEFGSLLEREPIEDPNDYPRGFQIRAFEDSIAEDPTLAIDLLGNMTPEIPFSHSGNQRINKIFYPGNDEPTMQVMGAVEDNVKIQGELKATRMKEKRFKGIPQAIRDRIDEIRSRGLLCQFTLGDTFIRWGFIESAEFQFERKTRIMYSLDLNIISKNRPRRIKFSESPRLVPLADNEDLINEFTRLQAESNSFTPPSRSIGDVIRDVTSEVAGEINKLTGYIDSVLSTADDIRRSVNTAIGLVQNVRNRIKAYRRAFASFDSFDLNQPLSVKYASANFYAERITQTNTMANILAKMAAALRRLRDEIPLGRHLVRQGDSLQKISVMFYDAPDRWREIAEFNDLDISQEISPGTILEIPR